MEVLFSLIFAEYFFNFKRTLYPAYILNNTFKLLVIFILIFMSISKNKTLPTKLGGFLGIFITIFLFLIGIYYFIKKFRPALYYLLAWSLFFFGIFLMYLVSSGIIKSFLFSYSSFRLGSLLLVIFMPIALLDKYFILKKEKILAEKTITENEKDKFASIGMLLGGISHEIYNPLSGITGPVDNLKKILSKEKLKESLKTYKYLEYIEKNTQRIDNIIKNVRALYKKQELLKEKLDINEISQSVIDNYKNDPGKMIDFKVEMDNTIEVIGDKNALYQILNNLISNAVESIKEKGKVIISLEKNNKEKFIKVEDNGIGIYNEDIDKIFNAFYTTKTIGNNIGLGLYIVKDLIIKSGWDIKVSSIKDKGTTFTIIIKE